MDPQEVPEGAKKWEELNTSLEGGDEFTPFWYFGEFKKGKREEMYVLHPQVTLRYDPAFFPYGMLIHGAAPKPRFFNAEGTTLLKKLQTPQPLDALCNAPQDREKVKAFLDTLVEGGYLLRGFYSRIAFAVREREPPGAAESSFPVPYPSVPHHTMIYLTYACNLACKHCGVRRDTSVASLSGRQWSSVLDTLERAGVYRVTLNGGEPLIHPDILEILKRISNSRLYCRLFTNGVFLGGRILDQLCRGNNFFLSVSLDGSRPETHDDFRGKRGTFEKVMNAFELLQKAPRNIPRIAATVIHRKNVDELGDILEIALQYDLWGVGFIAMNYVGETRRTGYYLSVQEHPEILENLRDISKKYEDRLSISIQGRGPTLKIPERNLPNFFENEFVCNSGILEWCLDPSGNVFPCEIVVTFPEAQQRAYTYGNITEQPLSDLWNSRKFHLFRGEYSSDNLAACKGCSFYEKCMTKKCRLYALSTLGDYNGPAYECQFSQYNLGITYFDGNK